MTILVDLCLVIGLFFHVVAAVGVLRMPDFYTRLHAVGKTETMGVLFTLAAVALWSGASLTSLKVLLVAGFLFVANTTATHAIGRAAHRTGLRPWSRPPLSSR